MPNVGQHGGWIVAVLAVAAVMAQIGATRVVAETPAHKATASCPGGSTGITLPKGFCATIFADKIGHARQLAAAPDGTVFVDTWSGRYYGNDKPHEGGFLVALKDTKGVGQADLNVRFGQTFAEGSHGGTGIALYKNWLYAEVNDRIVRYELKEGEAAPTGQAETILSGMPINGDHPMHPFAIDAQGNLFVSMGSAAGTPVLIAAVPLKECIRLPGIKDGPLFQKNVRQSLGSSNAVNKGIRGTIIGDKPFLPEPPTTNYSATACPPSGSTTSRSQPRTRSLL
jgi:glucose/arabinose dehydrogenase